MNRIVKRIKYNLFPRKTIEYIGCHAVNLGDQVLLDVIDQTFPGVLLNVPKGGNFPFSKDFAKWEASRPRLASMLGGGTLIGPGAWGEGNRKRFEDSIQRLGRGIVFGTGAVDLDFPSYQKDLKETPDSYRHWSDLLNRCEYVGVRGPRTKATLAKIGVDVEIIGDPVCSLVRPKGFWRPSEGTLGINVGYGHGIWGDEDQFFAEMTRFVSDIIHHGWNVEFFVVIKGDLKITKKIASGVGISQPMIHCEYVDAQKYMDQVCRMQAFVGLKLHAVVIAMCALVPSIMIEYRPKCLDFMSSVGLEFFNIRTSEASSATLFPLLKALVKDGERISEKIRIQMLHYKELQKDRAREFLDS